ncbi:hypothetical protein GLV95_12995 [Staphylococcus agnetis]|nr:hypothetical protein [Staphylococcus agnetis]
MSVFLLLRDLEEEYGIAFEDSDDIDTIGGWLQSQNTELEQDDYIDTQYDRWIVSEIENHQIISVLLRYECHEERHRIGDEDDETLENAQDK